MKHSRNFIIINILYTLSLSFVAASGVDEDDNNNDDEGDDKK
jgi:hypothetical protein